MALFAPAYYPRFHCIADQCPHSCCVDWEIDLDPRTVSLYRHATHPYGDTLRKSLTYDSCTDTHSFCLTQEGKCPHLDERGLCRIISQLGEAYLTTICCEHPRFYHTRGADEEVGVGMSCPEACRILLTSDAYASWICVEGDALPSTTPVTALREEVYRLLQDKTCPYPARLLTLWETYDCAPDRMTDEAWQAVFSSLEYLDACHAPLFAAYTSHPSVDPVWYPYLERALAYFLFRHLTEDTDTREALTLACLLERTLASLLQNIPAQDTAQGMELARILSEELEYSPDNMDTLLTEIAFL